NRRPGGVAIRCRRAAGTDGGPHGRADPDFAESAGTGKVAYVFAIADRALDGLRDGERLDVTYTVTLSDGHGGLATRPVGITLIGTNDAPVARDAEAVMRTGRALTGTLEAADVDSESLTFAAVAGPAHGRLSLGQDGTYAYTPDAGFRGTDSFTYRASDGSLDSNLATVTVAVGGGSAPVITSGAQAVLNLTAGPSGKVLTPLAASYLTAGNSLVAGLGGAAGFGEASLGPNDDESTGAIDIRDLFGPQGLNFNRSYTSLYVNNNGNITFDGPLEAFRPSSIGGGSPNPIIAPFWADVDTSTGSQTVPTPGGRSTGSNRVHIDKDAANGVITVTWDDVGYFSNHTDRLNAFQLQLIDLGNGNFDIVYRYEAVNWTLGDYSGGLHARAGYSAGNGTGYYELPQSGSSAGMLALPATPGNTGTAGLYVFEVQNGSVIPGGNLQGSGTIGFSDADPGDVHTVETSIEVGSIHWRRADGSDAGAMPAGLAARLANAFTAQITAESAAAGAGTGSAAWTLAVPKADVAFLGAGDTLSLVCDVVIRDDAAQSAPATVAVTIAATDHGPVLGGSGQAVAAHGGSVVVTAAALSATDPDDAAGALTYIVAAGASGHFTIDGLQTFAPVMRFTQADIDAGRVIYHTGETAGAAEQVALGLSDAAGALASGTLTVTLTDVARGETVIWHDDGTHALAVPTEALLFNDAGHGAPLRVDAVVPVDRSSAGLNLSRTAVSLGTDLDGNATFVYEALDAQHPASNAARVVVQAASGQGAAGFAAVTGTAGDDVLIAGSRDAGILSGGAGHDVFVFAAAPGAGPPTHRVTDFDAAADAIDLAGFGLAPSERIEDALHLTGTGASGYDLSIRGTPLVHLDLAGEIHDAITVIWSSHLAQLAIPTPV
ncbi:MAG TPA: nidogen-like domain-containing protein, partial [Methylobacterium sp.]|nr:nidogen-like domain-containing protein [Methylobacterium sp.]